MYVRNAVEYAGRLVMFSRSKEAVAPGDVVGQFVRLEEQLRQLDAHPKKNAVFKAWPRTSGTALALKVGASALTAGEQFANSICTGSLCGGVANAKCYRNDERLLAAMVDPPSTMCVTWAEGVLEELRTMTIPPQEVWPGLGIIRKDIAMFHHQLADEFESAIGATAKHTDPIETEPTLSNRQMQILRTLLSLGAVNPDCRCTTQRIADTAGHLEHDSDGYKEPVAALVTMKLVLSKRGSGGGVWLTKAGRLRAQRLPKKR